MTINYKILGQLNPIANTPSTLYTVPADRSAVISTLQICNMSSNASTIRISTRIAGATLANNHYLVYDTAIGGNDSLSLTIGITLANTDIVTVSASTSNVAFNLFGSEIV